MALPAFAQEPPPSTQPTATPNSPERKTSTTPKPAVTPPAGGIKFEAEPVRDGAIVAISLGFSGLLEAIDSTGEVHPQQISVDFDTNNLLPFDRGAVTQKISNAAGTVSNIGLFGLIGFAVVDPILSGYRQGNVQSAIVDGALYAESISVTWAITNLAKIAVRRPRPIAYQTAAAHKDDPNYMSNVTDTALSFFSGHASISSAVVATASYLAFARSPGTARPWITLGVGTAVVAAVGWGRVRSGAHFPTDVLAGVLAGAGIGILVPHFHRSETEKQRPLWIGFVPEEQGGAVSLSGVF